MPVTSRRDVWAIVASAVDCCVNAAGFCSVEQTAGDAVRGPACADDEVDVVVLVLAFRALAAATSS